MALVYLSCAWVLGIFLGATFDLPFAFILIGLLPLVLLPFLCQYKRTIILTCLCIVIFFTGNFYFGLSQPSSNERNLSYYNDQQQVIIKGIIDETPELRDKATHLYLKATQIQTEQKWQEISGTALLMAHRYSSYNYGDLI